MPKEDYRVELEVFEGPLDLLLYLAKKQEVDIYKVSIEQITTAYLEYMSTFKMLNIDLASEFIVMAANLMYIKSRSLLPQNQQTPLDDEESEDPRWELIRQLVEYKKFKDAAHFLRNQEVLQDQIYTASPESIKAEENLEAQDQLNVGIFDLIKAFQDVLNRFDDQNLEYEIFDEQYTVSDKIDYLLDTISYDQQKSFSTLFHNAENRSEIIVTFLALLELIKLKQFSIKQDELLGEIHLKRCSENDEPARLA